MFFPFFFPSFSSFFLSSPYPILSHVNQTHDERAMSEGAVCTQRRMTLLDAPVPCRTHSPHGRSDLLLLLILILLLLIFLFFWGR